MPEGSSTLPGAEHGGLVHIREDGPRGMVSLKAALDAGTGAVLQAVTGQGVPAPRRIEPPQAPGGMQVAWMAPDEVLILCDHDRAGAVVADLSGRLAGTHHLAVNLSDARAMFTLEGAAIRDVLSKLTPADLGALAPGEMRRSHLGQVAAAFWFDAPDRARLICFRSVAVYVRDLLMIAARPGGEVGFH